MKKFRVTCFWTMCKIMDIEAEGDLEASEEAKARVNTDQGSFVDGSLDVGDVEEWQIHIPEDVKSRISSDPDKAAEDLDPVVHDVKGDEAAEVNNQGAEGQVEYLKAAGVSWNVIRQALGLPEVKGGK